MWRLCVPVVDGPLWRVCVRAASVLGVWCVRGVCGVCVVCVCVCVLCAACARRVRDAYVVVACLRVAVCVVSGARVGLGCVCSLVCPHRWVRPVKCASVFRVDCGRVNVCV